MLELEWLIRALHRLVVVDPAPVAAAPADASWPSVRPGSSSGDPAGARSSGRGARSRERAGPGAVRSPAPQGAACLAAGGARQCGEAGLRIAGWLDRAFRCLPRRAGTAPRRRQARGVARHRIQVGNPVVLDHLRYRVSVYADIPQHAVIEFRQGPHGPPASMRAMERFQQLQYREYSHLSVVRWTSGHISPRLLTACCQQLRARVQSHDE